jgi:hypothetical protein
MKFFEKIKDLPNRQYFWWFFWIALLIVAIFIQHRFWLFGAIYSDPTNTMPGDGDANYNLSTMMQSALNFINGQWLSLEADHYTWWIKALGVTAHQTFFGVVFYILFLIANNSALAYNIIQFGNLWMIQIGVFFLAKRFGSNNYFAIIAALLIPLSQSYQTLYPTHVHASYYGLLPFIILFLDIFIEEFNLSSIKKALLIAGLTFGGLLTVLSDWHVFVFSSVFVGIYVLFRTKFIILRFNKHFKHYALLLIPALIVSLFAIPLIFNTLESSRVHNSVRTVGDVSGTSFTIEAFLGIDSVIGPVINTIGTRYPELGVEGLKVIEVGRILNRSRSTYPDPLFNFSFWLSLFILIPWIVLLIKNKGNYYSKEFALLVIFLVTSIIIVGPLLKLNNRPYTNIPLPYYILYKLYYPFQAIRAVWRAAIIGYIAIIIIWSGVLTKIWNYINHKISNTNFKRVLIAYFSLFLIFGLLFQNSGFVGGSKPAIKNDSELISIFDDITNGSTTEIYVWRYSDQELDNYIVNISRYNLKNKNRLINWVMGGIHGAPPYEATMVSNMHHLNRNINLIPQVLRSKNVPFVIQEKNSDRYFGESKFIDNYYNLDFQTSKYAVWKLDESSSIQTKAEPDYSLSGSRYLGLGVKYHGFFNTENMSDQIFANPNQIVATKYDLKLEKDSEVKFQSSFESGQAAFLLPKMGKSINFSFTPRFIEPGNYNLKIYNEDRLLAEKSIEILENSNFKDKIKTLRSTQTSLEKVTNFASPYNFTPRLETQQKLTLKINSGGIFNESTFGIKPLKDKEVIAQFSKNGVDDAYLFGKSFEQAPCPLYGDYFEGDEVVFWCKQLSPFDMTFNQVYPYISQQN